MGVYEDEEVGDGFGEGEGGGEEGPGVGISVNYDGQERSRRSLKMVSWDLSFSYETRVS